MNSTSPAARSHDLYASLRANKLFAGFVDAAVAECCAQFTPLRIHKRRSLFRQGDAGTQMYLVLDGFVRISRLTEDGRDLTLGVASRGEFFGEEALLGENVRPSSANTLEDCVLAFATVDSLAGLIKRYPLLALNIARSFRADHDRALKRAHLMHFAGVGERLLSLLRQLALDFGADTPEGTRIEPPLTQAHLASLIGASRETVSSEMSKLARSGRVSKCGRRIILRPAATAA